LDLLYWEGEVEGQRLRHGDGESCDCRSRRVSLDCQGPHQTTSGHDNGKNYAILEARKLMICLVLFATG
jgi:hypothetical protein